METNIGQRFGRLEILRIFSAKTKNGSTIKRAECICICGNSKITNLYSLKSGITKSCGCLRSETLTKHGLSGHKLYHVWESMVSRCYNINDANYYNYGERNIKMSNEWRKNAGSFINWALNNGWKCGLTIERDNTNGNYSEDNCIIATRKEQQSNRRITIMIEHKGESKSLIEWAKILKMKECTLRHRLMRKCISVEDAFNKPLYSRSIKNPDNSIYRKYERNDFNTK